MYVNKFQNDVKTVLPAVLGLLAVLIVSGCSTASGYRKDGSLRRVWAPPAFGQTLHREVAGNQNYLKAAPQLQSNALVAEIAEEIDDQVQFELIDWLMPVKDKVGSEVWVFTNYNSPEIKPPEPQRVVFRKDKEEEVFLVSLRILRPMGIRETGRYGPAKKYPLSKTVSVQYRLECSPQTPRRRVLVFHRQLILEAENPDAPENK